MDERVPYIPGVVVITPRRGIHYNDLVTQVKEAGLRATHLTETMVKIQVPQGKESIYMRRLTGLSFVDSVQRDLHFNPPV